jgi:NDP-sugar pyrophosphorylase family protein
MLGDYERVDDGRRHPTARVHRSARLIGPVLLGPHACVNERAVIVGPAAVGAGSVIGAGALVARSLIWDGCTVGELAIVDGALLTSHVMVPARAVVSGGTHVAHDAPAASPPSPARSRIVEPPAGAKSHDRPARPPVKPPSGYVRPLGRRGGDPQATGERPSGP